VKRHLRIRVHGRVQGVYFRQGAKREALRLGLSGYARNEPDGTVLIEVEGEQTSLDRFLDWCATGPPDARVAQVETADGELVGYRGFDTR
jgi:acylphosphatase